MGRRIPSSPVAFRTSSKSNWSSCLHPSWPVQERLHFARIEQRRKPFGDLAGRTIGIDRDENRVGLEASWNEELAGVTGRQLQRRVAGGQWMPVSDDYIVEPVAGYDVISSIDMHLQDVASNALRRQFRNTTPRGAPSF